MTVRVAAPDDIPELVRIINAAYRVEDFFVSGDRVDAAAVTSRMNAPGSCFLVLDHTDRPGLMAAVQVAVHGDRGHFALLSVDPECQGHGLGRALVAAAEAHCRAAGCTHMDLDVVNLREELFGFYGALGYVPDGRTGPLGDPGKLTRPAHLVGMSKPLSG